MVRLHQKGLLFSDFSYIRWLLNPDVFWILRSDFGFWDVFLDSVDVFLDCGKCFWNLGRVLDSGKCFWILESILSLRVTVDLYVWQGRKIYHLSPLIETF